MIRNRKSIRLKNWDYRNDGLYFISICTKNRRHYFGEIEHEKMILSPCGAIANVLWSELPHRNKNISLGEFVVMPNHIHGIIQLDNSLINENQNEKDIENNIEGDIEGDIPNHIRTDVACNVPTTSSSNLPTSSSNLPMALSDFNNIPKNQRMANISPKKNSISTLMRSYKSAVTKHCKRLHLEFEWQSRFHDHIIRNEKSFLNISNYIINNPLNWKEDKFW